MKRILTITLAMVVAGFVPLGYSREQKAEPTAQRETPPREPSASELSKRETISSAFLRGMKYQEYQIRSAAEAMPEEKYGYRPAEGKFKNEKPEFGPAEVRTFAEQIKHVACANFAFAAELDGQKPPTCAIPSAQFAVR